MTSLNSRCGQLLWLILPLVASAQSSSESAPPLLSSGPLGAIHAHVCGFHFYAGELGRQVRADHYCTHVSAEVWQCIVYDSDQRGARLVGVEYVISEKLFQGLPEAEKRLWHSHRFEVTSGQLIAPGMPPAEEQKLMADFASTYGKTWQLWPVDRDDRVPLGLPKLLMGFTADGQADPQLVAARDRSVGVQSAEVRARRVGLPPGRIAPGADGWETGESFQIDDSLLRPPSVRLAPRSP